MSTDTFARATFPRLGGPDDGPAQERERRRGYADGHAEGFRVATAEAADAAHRRDEERAATDALAAQELSAAVAALHAAARSLGDRERALAATANERVLRHAVDLAELVLAAELSDHGTSAAAAARRVLDTPAADGIRTLRLHPDDLRTLRERSIFDDDAAFALVADDTLDRGDAVAELEHGVVDARIAAALQRARVVLDGSGA